MIGRAIESYAKRFGYGVVRDYTGHGVGRAFHSGLVIPHYDAPSTTTSWCRAWSSRSSRCSPSAASTADIWADDWTVTTRDKSLTAQFEHTLVVTERGAERPHPR